MGPGVWGEDQLLVVTIFPTSGQPWLPEFSGFTPPALQICWHIYLEVELSGVFQKEAVCKR